MFMEIAVAAIGIAIVLLVGYLVVGTVAQSLLTAETYANPCYGLENATYCIGGANTSATLTNTSAGTGVQSTLTTVFAGFALVAVGIIVLAAFGLVNVFR